MQKVDFSKESSSSVSATLNNGTTLRWDFADAPAALPDAERAALLQLARAAAGGDWTGLGNPGAPRLPNGSIAATLHAHFLHDAEALKPIEAVPAPDRTTSEAVSMLWIRQADEADLGKVPERTAEGLREVMQSGGRRAEQVGQLVAKWRENGLRDFENALAEKAWEAKATGGRPASAPAHAELENVLQLYPRDPLALAVVNFWAQRGLVAARAAPPQIIRRRMWQGWKFWCARPHEQTSFPRRF
ncbi:hypothetical protein BH18VER2_BH18VER2_13490 [soil metagenome]